MLLLNSFSPQVAFVGSETENAVNVRLFDKQKYSRSATIQTESTNVIPTVK